MKNTDILASTHGAQLTNMLFMPKGSSVMEMFPTGWLESAGVGQFIYQWFPNWTELHYEGAWRDPTGLNCSKPVGEEDDPSVLISCRRTKKWELMLATWLIGQEELSIE